MKTVLIAGCGYIGLQVALTLKKEGHDVTGWVFSEESGLILKNLGITVLNKDLSEASSWVPHQNQYDVIVYCPSTRGGAAADYRRIYVEGLNLAATALKKGGQLFYTSSTSVYGQTAGVLVDESSPTHPTTETGRILLEAETVALSAHGTVLRLSAIYGPDRGVLIRRFLEGATVIAGNPDRFLNQIHQADVVAAIRYFLQHSEYKGVYNLSDSLPATHREIYNWLAQTLNKPMPEFSGEPALRKRGDSDRRVSNTKILGAGFKLTYPNFQKGYLPLLKAQGLI